MRRSLFSLCLLLALIATGPRPVHAATTAERAPATLYLHGHFGGPHSMDYLMHAAEVADKAHAVITATVKRNGHVRLRGRWPANTRRPLVKIVFQNNRTMRYHRISNWLHNVLVALQRRYHIKRFNIVAHSLGNAAVLFYMLRYGQDRTLPQLNKYAAIAGNFDGIPGRHRGQHPNALLPSGRPRWLAPPFRQALALRRHFPVDQVDILNLYGNLDDGTHSDGKILNASSRSLGYLLGKQARHYQEKAFNGAMAQHSMLRLNAKVATTINRFLWH
ncbi:alpha/beta hydrolase [Lacticaseibacillus absianus]|uniref:alpha/beta hydrolase n=1 Tax=Lacticaseibacillus absianus TaxID=2729623 RepID=UPI0015CD289E|nr:alpha/beta hydrolase [Lacticaseibacillus absianus]